MIIPIIFVIIIIFLLTNYYIYTRSGDTPINEFIESVKDLREYNKQLFDETVHNIAYFVELHKIITYEKKYGRNIEKYIDVLFNLKKEIKDNFLSFTISVPNGLFLDKCIKSTEVIEKIMNDYISDIDEGYTIEPNDYIEYSLTKQK